MEGVAAKGEGMVVTGNTEKLMEKVVGVMEEVAVVMVMKAKMEAFVK